MGYWKDIFVGAVSLVEGMRVTFRRLFQPVVTVQYPRKRVELSPAYRGHIELKCFEDTDSHRCIACGTCQRMCPTGVIKVQGIKVQAKAPKVATHYMIDFTRCSLCGLCVECCPTDALKYSKDYEMEGSSRWDGVLDLMARFKEERKSS